jgi:hypothetical protein
MFAHAPRRYDETKISQLFVEQRLYQERYNQWPIRICNNKLHEHSSLTSYQDY